MKMDYNEYLEKVKLYRNKDFNKLHTQVLYEMKIRGDDVGIPYDKLIDLAFVEAKNKYYRNGKYMLEVEK